MKLFKLFALLLVALPSVSLGMELGLRKPSEVVASLLGNKQFTYPDSTIFGSCTNNKGPIPPVSITISDKQQEWLEAKHQQEPFCSYSFSVDAVRLYGKNGQEIKLDRCFPYGKSGCCVIKDNGTLVVACEKHEHMYAKPKPPLSWYKRAALSVGRSALVAPLLGVVVYTAIVFRQRVSDILGGAIRSVCSF
jgi:hypothetical protein